MFKVRRKEMLIVKCASLFLCVLCMTLLHNNLL